MINSYYNHHRDTACTAGGPAVVLRRVVAGLDPPGPRAVHAASARIID